MSPKELMYLEDALGHEQFMVAQCKHAEQSLSNAQLKTVARQMAQQHQQLFDKLYGLI